MLFASLALVLPLSTASAASSIEGTWSGSGTAHPKDGKPERVSCRVTYKQQSSNVYGIRATCATSSNKINQTGSLLEVNPNRYVGDFYNAQYDVSGRVRVTVSGSTQNVSFESPRGRGTVTLRKR
ncbi:hypothetical protein HT051_04120 [Methyloligella sp. GL2]|nr:hypothetical protein HT051_04120 [Methyloligella sp. GL2]